MQAQGAEDELVDLAELGLVDPPIRTGKDSWSTQLFRSIDARTALFDEARLSAFVCRKVDDIEGVHFVPVLQKERSIRTLTHMLRGQQGEFHRTFATENISTFCFDRDLTLKKGRNIDDSVHSGIVYHIRRAEHGVHRKSIFSQ
jgi:hypothetical protein